MLTMNARTIITVAALVVGTAAVRAADSAAVARAVEERRITIRVSDAYPQGGAPIALHYNYGISLRGDSIVSYLPYYGRAYDMPYPGDEGTDFDAAVTNYRAVWNARRKRWQIEWRVRRGVRRISYYMTLHINGSATLSVRPDGRSSITFDGELSEEAIDVM